MKILFFLESLHSGGKERRAVELFYYLKQHSNIDFEIVITEHEIHFEYIFELNIPIHIMSRKYFKKDPIIFYKFYKIVKTFRPDIIHTWGMMTTFYAIPAAKFLAIILLNSSIADSFPKQYRPVFSNIVWKIDHRFSDMVTANSNAGLKAYNVNSSKGTLIYNGIRLERFSGLRDRHSVKKLFKINTPYIVIMVANLSENKDHDLLVDVAKEMLKIRDDITFISVGEGNKKNAIMSRVQREQVSPFLFTGRISAVEELINASDIGLLLSNIETGEGISNAIIEYMALSKPVIATDAGGTNELVSNNVSGFLVKQNLMDIVKKINLLLDDSILREEMGKKGREIINNKFRLDIMGSQFNSLYYSLKK